jgi:hypothetical protein
MYCNLCGKKMIITAGILNYNTVHNCITGAEVVCMYDENDDLAYCGLPLELETVKGNEIQQFLKSFLIKEKNSTNQLYMRALRKNTINNIVKTYL